MFSQYAYVVTHVIFSRQFRKNRVQKPEKVIISCLKKTVYFLVNWLIVSLAINHNFVWLAFLN